jgi:hypothetical protein
MKFVSIRILTLMALVMLATQAQAILLTPGDCIIGDNCWTSDVNKQPKAGDIEALVATGSNLNMLFKAQVGGNDEGLFADSYDTTFSNPANDPADALIEYFFGAAISCPECYLTVKGGGGNNQLSLYIFDISNWNGTDNIELLNFWPAQGAISNVAIWGAGSPASVPEPVTLALLGAGLLGVSFSARRKRMS